MPDSVTNQYEPSEVSPPGATLMETIEALGMSQAQLAERLGRPRKTVNEIIHGRAAITPETALQLESVLGVPAEFWINREARYREFLARRHEEGELASGVDWARRFPYRALVRRGWLAERPAGPARVRELLRFFGVASPEVWQERWSQLEVAFRRSTRVGSDRYAIAAWLRRGELHGQALDCAPYSEQRLLASLRDARALTCCAPEAFQSQLTAMFAAAGVAMAWVPELPRCPVSGATRWLTPEKALIQVSLRFKTDDQLWFSIFHEAFHVLRHPRKRVFIEDGGRETEEEREANRLAADLLIPAADLARLVAQSPLSLERIRSFAHELGIAPGIVVGRLQHEGHLAYSHGTSLKTRFRWVDQG